MGNIIDALVLGMYLPIVVFSGFACWLFVSRLLWPAVREGSFSIDQYALAIAASCALAAHFTENLYFGIPRWLGEFDAWNDMLPIVGLWKTLILASALFATAALSKAATDGAHLGRLLVIALSLWAGASAVAMVVT